MDLRDILRSFFRFNETNDNLFNRDSDFYNNKNNSDFSNNLNDFESEMSRDFEDIVQTFGQMFDVFNRFSLINDLNDSNQWQELDTKPQNPRDLMIKSKEDIQRQDIDYDQRVREKGLNSLFNEKHKYESNVMRSPIETKSMRRTYFYSSFNNNGRIEEQKTTEDQFGNSESIVTQKIGDQVLTRVVKRNIRNEIIETNEMISNLDQNDLNEFKDKFNRNGIQAGNDIMAIEDKPNKDSLLKRLFKLFV